MPKHKQNEGDANQFYLVFVLRLPTLSNYIYIKPNSAWMMLALFVLLGLKGRDCQLYSGDKPSEHWDIQFSALNDIFKKNDPWWTNE